MMNDQMTEKVIREIPREALADYFEKLAGELRAGVMSVADRTWAIPGSLETKIRFKEKNGRMTAKVHWGWSTLNDYSDQDRKKVEQKKTSIKSIKQRLSAAFKKLTKAAESGMLPDKSILVEFEVASLSFNDMAEPEWKEEMVEYIDHLENLKHALEAGQLKIVQHELRDLKSRMKACHRGE
jgi:XXXCH domain-containing protein